MVRMRFHVWLAGACAIALMSFLGLRVDWEDRGSPLSKNLKTGAISEPIKSPLSRDEIEPALNSLLDRHRAALKSLEHNDYFYPGLCCGLGWGLQSGTVQARILAICHPQETEAFVLKIVEDPQAKDSDLHFATKVLGILATRGRSASSAALAKLAQDGKPEVVPIALKGLASCDKDGLLRALYPNACKRGIFEAFDVGPYWVDQPTKQALQEILTQNLKKYSDDYYSREALERMSILESRERNSLLEQLVAGEPPGGVWVPGWTWQRQQWALRVIEKTPTPRTLESLRRRLHREETLFAKWYPRTDISPPTHPGWTGTSDYDEFLLTYFTLGGELNAVETERLAYYGYLGNPGRQLRELLSHWCRSH